MHTNASNDHLAENDDDNQFRAENHYHDHLNDQNNHQNQYQNQNLLDREANELCSNVHSSISRAFDASYQMPISEHVYYRSFQSYDNLLVEQRRTLNNMMNCLSQAGNNNNDHNHSNSYYQHHQQQQNQHQQQQYQQYPSSIATNQQHQHPQQHNNQRNQNAYNGNRYHCDRSSGVMNYNNTFNNNFNFDCETMENLRNSYDYVQEFTESMLDNIGQNIDDAAGYLSRDARMVQATLDAANQARLFTTPTNIGSLINNNSNNSLNSSSTNNKSTSKPSFINQNNNKNIHQQQQYHTQAQRNRTRFSVKEMMGGVRRFAQLENKNIARPQSHFQDKIDNSYKPFKPIIKEKPNALVPLKLVFESDDHGNDFYSHPYEYELQNFQLDLDKLSEINSSEPSSLDSTPIIWVETVEQLEDMCRHIENQEEFAVDVEHHSYRSFQGITCLLQISTRTQDFVIDAIQLRSELHRLNKSFTNPSIVKVFHGADCDVLWLQRDFGVYVVKLFDTSRAAKLMKFAHLSLAFLMQHYCNLEPDKSYQLADWRERPLPLPMLQYARADTHYLLYIYDRLRNDLLTKSKNKTAGMDLINNVYERGREICSKRYEKPPFSDTSHRSVLRKSRSTFNAKQMFAFKELYAWRDSMSRELDESLGYVLPNNLMIRIAEYLPREPQGITALCNPMPPTVKKYLSDIHGIILKALSVPLDDLSKAQVSMIPNIKSVDLDTINHKQDIAHSAGIHEGSVGPNLLDRMNLLNCSADDAHDQQARAQTKLKQSSSDGLEKSEKARDSKDAKNRQNEGSSKKQSSSLYDIL